MHVIYFACTIYAILYNKWFKLPEQMFMTIHKTLNKFLLRFIPIVLRVAWHVLVRFPQFHTHK